MAKHTYLKALTFTVMSAPALAADGGIPLSDVTRTLLVGGDALTKVMWAACIIVGIALIAAAFTQFQIHRRNPKLVPLTTPILYLILGIVAIAIPFVDTMKGFMGSEKKQVSSSAAPNAPKYLPKKKVYNPNDIDAPLN